MRPQTAHRFLASARAGELPTVEPAARRTQPEEQDPGWALEALVGLEAGPLPIVADGRWWSSLCGPEADAVDRLWKHGVATACSARRLATEAGRADADRLARIGLIHALGYWLVAAASPGLVVELLAEPDPERRRSLERSRLGIEAGPLGRQLAVRRGADPLLADAAWLLAEADAGLAALSVEPDAFGLLLQARSLAERTPWALAGPGRREDDPDDARVRLLMAEVQVRCGSGLAGEATAAEQELAREHARLLLRMTRLEHDVEVRDRFLEGLASTGPADDRRAWSDRAARAWCGLPGISAARVAWPGEIDASGPRDTRPPSRVLPAPADGPEVRLWDESDASGDDPAEVAPATLAAWEAWVRYHLALETRQRQLDEALALLRKRRADAEDRSTAERLASLAEFAAGAGHELNNPLAVILGRAQLLLARTNDADAVRSLRAIIGQAQRAHRILRDLMYVARPPQPRPRPCQPEELVRGSVRDLRAEAEARGIRLLAEPWESSEPVWADPDGLRHLIDVLVRNALEATPSGGSVHVSGMADSGHVRLVVRDTGRGLDPAAARHLLDPFYCGRQAGRGLGLGLPRAARFLTREGGSLRWSPAADSGTVFDVSLPISGAGPRQDPEAAADGRTTLRAS